MIRIDYAAPEDASWLIAHDRHISKEVLKRKIDHREILVARDDGICGWLRFGFFWDAIPFMNMLFLLELYRCKGIGSKLVGFWEQQTKEMGHCQWMVSTLADENAQHFYRKLGYRDIGGFVMPKEAMELILMKNLEE